MVDPCEVVGALPCTWTAGESASRHRFGSYYGRQGALLVQGNSRRHHTNLKVIKARSGEHRWKLDAATSDIIMELARLMPDMHIASVLNRAGKRTGRDNTWTEPRVRAFRNDHDIPVYRPGERAERGEITPLEAAEKLGISEMAVRRLIAKGALNARQACKGAPWVIKAETLVEVKLRRCRPVTRISTQRLLEF